MADYGYVSLSISTFRNFTYTRNTFSVGLPYVLLVNNLRTKLKCLVKFKTFRRLCVVTDMTYFGHFASPQAKQATVLTGPVTGTCSL